MSKNRDIMMSILTRRVRPILRELVESRFFRAKAILLSEVRSHPISVDISSHSPSAFLGSSSGTLYGFIGFDAQEQPNPVEDLIDFLDESITFIPSPRTPKGSLFSSSVFFPSKSSFNSSMFLTDWESRGWPIMIEEGISGLGNYINRAAPGSRSEEGYQSKNRVRSGDWSGKPYLSPLFANFRKNLLIS